MSGTLLVRGKAYLDVTRTGRDSALGRLATMLGDIEAARTPLERRIDRLGRPDRLLGAWPGLGADGHRRLIAEGLDRAPAIIIFAVALAVAAVPEGLPASPDGRPRSRRRADGPAPRCGSPSRCR